MCFMSSPLLLHLVCFFCILQRSPRKLAFLYGPNVTSDTHQTVLEALDEKNLLRMIIYYIGGGMYASGDAVWTNRQQCLHAGIPISVQCRPGVRRRACQCHPATQMTSELLWPQFDLAVTSVVFLQVHCRDYSCLRRWMSCSCPCVCLHVVAVGSRCCRRRAVWPYCMLFIAAGVDTFLVTILYIKRR